jgi:hypothetical protein
VSRTERLTFEFCDSFPATMHTGVLYVSLLFASASHLCCCGCGFQIVTPLRPNRWHMTFDGETVSLAPSIGNAGLPCRSHYWIKRNRVIWHYPLTAFEIERGRSRDGWVEKPTSPGAGGHRHRRRCSWLSTGP